MKLSKYERNLNKFLFFCLAGYGVYHADEITGIDWFLFCSMLFVLTTLDNLLANREE